MMNEAKEYLDLKGFDELALDDLVFIRGTERLREFINLDDKSAYQYNGEACGPPSVLLEQILYKALGLLDGVTDGS